MGCRVQTDFGKTELYMAYSMSVYDILCIDTYLLCQVFGFELSANKKYRYTGEITEKALKAFAQSVIDETAEPDYKSAEIPAEPLDEGVTVIVGKNFDSVVLDKTKDVLLEVGTTARISLLLAWS